VLLGMALMVGAALAEEPAVQEPAAPVVEVTLISRKTELQEFWSLPVSADGALLSVELPTEREKWFWSVELTMTVGAPPEAIPFQFQLSEVKRNRKGVERRRQVITEGEVVTHNWGRANFESVVEDHKGRVVEDFEMILRPRL